MGQGAEVIHLHSLGQRPDSFLLFNPPFILYHPNESENADIVNAKLFIKSLDMKVIRSLY